MTHTFSQIPQTFREKQEKSKKRLEEFLEFPGEEQIHDFRTSFRRLETVYLIFPNSFKRKKTDAFISSYKFLFKKTSPLRDYDIFIKKILENGMQENSEPVKYFTLKKEKKIEDALAKAKKLNKLKISAIRKGNFEKITPRYEKIVSSLVQKLQDYIPIVISDESKIEELHSMRKIAKKLRYLLEVEPNNSYLNLINKMKIFQEFLGDIHDCDITINLLKKHSEKFPELNLITKKEEENRKRIYKNLTDFFLADK